MKKAAKTLITLASLFTLVGCGDRYYINNCPEGESGGNGGTTCTPAEKTPLTFAEQCEKEGLAFTYVDPNPDFTKTEHHKGDDSITTGGSGNVIYNSIDTYEELSFRMGLKYAEYYWELDEENGVTTLAEAAALEDAKYMTDLFPNDGKAYSIKSFKNAIGSKIFYTTDKEGYGDACVIGGAPIVKEGDDYFLTVGWMTAGNNTTNLINNGKGSMLYYEFDYSQKDKSGPGTRNYGCRVQFDLVFATDAGDGKLTDGTCIMTNGGQKMEAVTLGNAPEYTTYSALKIKAKLTAIHALG